RVPSAAVPAQPPAAQPEVQQEAPEAQPPPGRPPARRKTCRAQAPPPTTEHRQAPAGPAPAPPAWPGCPPQAPAARKKRTRNASPPATSNPRKTSSQANKPSHPPSSATGRTTRTTTGSDGLGGWGAGGFGLPVCRRGFSSRVLIWRVRFAVGVFRLAGWAGLWDGVFPLRTIPSNLAFCLSRCRQGARVVSVRSVGVGCCALPAAC